MAYFNSPRYNRLIQRAGRLTGAERNQAYGRLDVDLAKNAAPAAALWNRNEITFVSSRVGCKAFNAEGLDLAAVCIKGG